MLKKHIILTGFMGSGKSTIGYALAKNINQTHIDTDSYIVEKEGKSIGELFENIGEAGFRELESKYLLEVLSNEPMIISTGGGIVKSQFNREKMRETGFVINLNADLSEIYQRLSKSTNRPLFNKNNTLELLQKLFSEREELYKDADLIIDTKDKSMHQVISEIIKILRGYII